MFCGIVGVVVIDWQEKCWGKTRELIATPFYSKYELNIIAGGYCSLHFHHQRANKFHLISGVVEIVELYGLNFCRTMLGPDNTYEVPSLITHMFLVHKSGIMFEEYYPDRNGIVEYDDIVRIIEGGNVPIDQLPTVPQTFAHLR